MHRPWGKGPGYEPKFHKETFFVADCCVVEGTRADRGVFGSTLLVSDWTRIEISTQNVTERFHNFSETIAGLKKIPGASLAKPSRNFAPEHYRTEGGA